jgi:succinate dehydrogenase/fumarate reductase cytochrome b subunit
VIRSWFEWMDALPSSIAMRESVYGYPYLLTAHAISMALFAGLIVMMDLRLVGFAYRRTPLSQVQRQLFPWQMVTMVASSITGALLFYSQPMRYYGKVFFWLKMALMLFAGINALWFHFTTYRTVAAWDERPKAPFGARLAGALSIVLWAGVVIFGRITAYDGMTYR